MISDTARLCFQHNNYHMKITWVHASMHNKAIINMINQCLKHWLFTILIKKWRTKETLCMHKCRVWFLKIKTCVSVKSLSDMCYCFFSWVVYHPKRRLRGYNWVLFAHRPLCFLPIGHSVGYCYIEFKLCYLKKQKLFSIRVK